eukprot:8879-Heterococcus_DN1.PRE.1
MGGASTQIIFPPAATTKASDSTDTASAAADAAASAAAAEATAACGTPDGSSSISSDSSTPSVCVVDVSAQQQGDATALVALSNTSTKVSPDDFWARSHLSYGVAEVRQRVWAHLVAEYKAAAAVRARHSSSNSSKQQQQLRSKPTLP